MTGEETFHPDTRALLAYGRALAGTGDPPRGADAPRADRLTERLFVFDRLADGRFIVRTFGAELIALFGADLRDRDLLGLWSAPDRALLQALVGAVDAAGQPGIARVRGESGDGGRIAAEILLTPLRTPPATADRYLGLFQPLGGEAFLGDSTIARLVLGALHPPEARAPAPRPRLVVVNR